jgi:hypothetical protein
VSNGEVWIEKWRPPAMIRVASPAAVLRCLIDRSDSMWTIGSLKPSGFEHLKTGRRRGLAIEYTLVALMVALQHFRSCSQLVQKPIRRTH